MAQLDLNLLRVFDALIREESVTAAAERLHLSIPATSRALGRLRRACGDPVLVRAGRGMVPTPYATQAAPRVRTLLEQATELLRVDREINPGNLERTFTIRMNDGVAATLAPAMVATVAGRAPGVALRFVAEFDESLEDLRDGSIDLDVRVGSFAAPDIRTAALYRERMVVIARADRLPAATAPLTLQRLCESHHVSTSRRGRARGPLDDVLAAAGLRRHVATVVPTYAAALLLVSSSPYLALVPQRLAEHYGRALGLRWFPVPADLPELHIRAAWHTRLDNDPAHRWLRDTLCAQEERSGTEGA